MPNYNSSKTISKTLESIKKQSFDNYELIIVDDCSTDNSKFKIFNTIIDNKIKLISLRKNSGPARARNIGIKKSRGQYLAFIDSDDIWYRNKLLDMYFCISSNRADVYCHNELFKPTKGQKYVIKNGPFTKNFYYDLLTNKNCLSTSAVIVESFFVKRNKIYFNEDRSFFSVEDYDYWMRLAHNKAKFYFSNKILGIYNFNDDSISSNYHIHYYNTLNVLKYHCYKVNNFKNAKETYDKASFRYKINFYKYQFLKDKNFFKILNILTLVILNPNSTLQHVVKKFNNIT
jgi:glycosyltransferase involved in cell wall biosynthesis